ncbi:hypothetical protein [Pseudothermotoga sp.]
MIGSVEDLFENKFSKILKPISKVKTPLIEVDIENDPSKGRSVAVILSNINEVLRKSNKKLVIALAHIYDFPTNIKVILTGSEVGALYDFLSLSDGKSALFGRHLVEVTVQRFSAENSLNFLVLGSNQANLNPDPEKSFVYPDDYDRALTETLETAEKMLESELNELFQKISQLSYHPRGCGPRYGHLLQDQEILPDELYLHERHDVAEVDQIVNEVFVPRETRSLES